MRRAVPEGIRITKVGVWFVLATLVIGVAATNTGNNALYLVVSLLLGMLVVSGVVSRRNVRALEVDIRGTDEVHANQPFVVSVRCRSLRRWSPHRLLTVRVSVAGRTGVIPDLPPGEERTLELESVARRRGLLEIRAVHVGSIYPLGLFRKGVRMPVSLEVLVYPELFPAATTGVERFGRSGDAPANRPGRGHELLALREFRAGDDRRGIHWKRSASSGRWVFMERESERGRRLSILFDNAVGAIETEAERQRFEGLVSEAATAADHYLTEGWEVELVTRDGGISWGSGELQRRRIFEHLALIEAAAATSRPLAASREPLFELRMGAAG